MSSRDPALQPAPSMPAGQRVVVIGASAGGIAALRTLVAGLPADFPAPVVVVVHVSPDSPRVLAEILGRSGPLPAGYALDGDVLAAGRIYVAPPDWHVVLDPEGVRLSGGPKAHHARPAIDPLFESAAQVYGPRAIGVVLSGMLDDGAAGLAAISAQGGIAIVQAPADAAYPDMPRHALARVAADHCLPADRIGARLAQLVRPTAPGAGAS